MDVTKAKACSTEQNFADFLNAGIKANKVAEAVTLAANSWAWNNTYKACHINGTSASVKETVELPLGYFKVGDVITLSAEFMNISGTKGKVALDFTGDVSGNAFISQTALLNEFEHIEITYTVKTEGTYTALFGIFTGDVGEFYVRNCVAKCESAYVDDYKPYKQVIKTFNITSTAVGTFSVIPGFSPDEGTVTVNVNYLLLTFTKPFTYTALRPLVFIGIDSTGKSYRIIVTSPQVNTVTIQLYDYATNNLVNHTTIPGGVYFSVMAVGYDKL